MITGRLDQATNAQFDANGVAIATLGPRGPVTWEISRLTVSSTSTLPSQARLFDGPGGGAELTNTNLIEGTYSGNLDATDTPFTIQPGSQLYIQWTGGTPGATATVRVIGRQEWNTP